MSGKLPPDNPVSWRSNSGLQYKDMNVVSSGIKISGTINAQRDKLGLPQKYIFANIPSFNFTRDLSGGFYEDGIWGPVKLTKSNALSTAVLGWSLLEAEKTWREDRYTFVRPAPPSAAHSDNHRRVCAVFWGREPASSRLIPRHHAEYDPCLGQLCCLASLASCEVVTTGGSVCHACHSKALTALRS
jgi:hypothetical protein